MKLELRPLPTFGAELTAWDFSKPCTEELIKGLRQALLKHKMLVIRGRTLSPEELLELTRVFGSKLFVPGPMFRYSDQYTEIVRLSNQSRDNIQNCACESWHCDGHYLADPCAVTVMNMAPAAGGAISVADMQEVYELIPPSLQAQLAKLRCRNQASKVIKPLVINHPASGRRGLYINMYAQTIDSAGNRVAEIDSILDKLLEHRTYKHYWQTGDIMIVDNFAVTHKVCPADPAAEEILQRSQTCESGSWWQRQSIPLSCALSAQPPSKLATA